MVGVIGGDGCSQDCKLEEGFVCTGGSASKPDKCSPQDICGDTERHSGEECDDGNTVSGDGCSSTCKIEDGWMCGAADGQKDQCAQCGNGQQTLAQMLMVVVMV